MLTSSTRVAAEVRRRSASQRLEDPRFLTGRGRYVDDIALPGMLHVGVRAQPARRTRDIDAIDAAAALRGSRRASPSSRAADLAGRGGRSRATRCCATSAADGRMPVARRATGCASSASRSPRSSPTTATSPRTRVDAGRGRATSRSPVVDRSTQAIRTGAAPASTTARHDNIFNTSTCKHAATLDAAFAAARRTCSSSTLPHRTRRRRADRGRGCHRRVRRDRRRADDLARRPRARTWCAPALADALRHARGPRPGHRARHRRRLRGQVGIYPEEIARAARWRGSSGRPVKWIEDRRENLLATHARPRADPRRRGRASTPTARSSACARRIVRRLRRVLRSTRWRSRVDYRHGPASCPGPYRINGTTSATSYAVATNKAPHRRRTAASARPEACFAMERVDRRGRRASSGIDPLEVRRRNLIQSDEYPYDDRSPGLRLRQRRLRRRRSSTVARGASTTRACAPAGAARAEGRYLGIGFAHVHRADGAHGPTGVPQRRRADHRRLRDGDVRIEPDRHGARARSARHATARATRPRSPRWSPTSSASIRRRDRARRRHRGDAVRPRHWASRSAVSPAARRSARGREVREPRCCAIAAELLEAEPGDLELEDGARQRRRHARARRRARGDRPGAYHRPERCPTGIEPRLEARRDLRRPRTGTFANAAHVALVEVDLETGPVRVIGYVGGRGLRDDDQPARSSRARCRAAWPGHRRRAARGGRLRRGRPAARHHLHGLPAARLRPTMPGDRRSHHLETPSPLTLGGFKGMGEGGCIDAVPPIANAVSDALRPIGRCSSTSCR